MINKEPPERIGKFRITGRIGKGGMGDVYKGIQEPLNRTVAIKVLPEEYARNEEFLQRFVTEAKAISLLEHQNIVGIYDYGVESGLQYIAMRYIEGQSLAHKLAAEKKLPPETAVEYARQICRALKYAHEKDILHRDIKPQNILLGPGGRVFVTDFGIAKLYEQSSVTRTGVVVGTPEYMSPEQAEGKELNCQTDLYSLGIVLYEMLTGEPPFLGDNPLAIAYKHVNVPPPPISEKVSGIPRRLELVVLKALKKDRTVRYQNGDEFLQDLDRVFEDTTDPVTRGMERISIVHGSTPKEPFEDDKRITDRRELDRRREPRRAGHRRYSDAELKIIRQRRRRLIVAAVLLVSIAVFIAVNLLKNSFRHDAAQAYPLYLRISGEGTPERAVDDNVRTSWIGKGNEPAFSLSFWKADAVNRMDIISGSHHEEGAFNKAGRPKKVRLLFNEKDEFVIDLDDTPERQVVRLPVVRAVRSVKLTVLEYFSGSEIGTGVAISEARFWLAPVP
jgi:serine/threonine-protein kinase